MRLGRLVDYVVFTWIALVGLLYFAQFRPYVGEVLAVARRVLPLP